MLGGLVSGTRGQIENYFKIIWLELFENKCHLTQSEKAEPTDHVLYYNLVASSVPMLSNKRHPEEEQRPV